MIVKLNTPKFITFLPISVKMKRVKHSNSKVNKKNNKGYQKKAKVLLKADINELGKP